MLPQRFALSVLVLATIAASCRRPAAGRSDPTQFFENSQRRDPTAAEAEPIVHFAEGCTGFFVENTAGKILIASAGHCVEHDVAAWCQKGGKYRDRGGTEGTCKGVVAATAQHDIVLIEGDKRTQAAGPALRLASYVPPVGLRLKMIGFPADPLRAASTTVTENCWVLSESVPSPYADLPGPDGLQDRASRHNCSTYGGNSGGPMLADGTSEVVGLPYTYDPKYPMLPATELSTAAHLAQMAEFVELNAAALKAAGVVTVAVPSQPVPATAPVPSAAAAEFAAACAKRDEASAEARKTYVALLAAAGSDDCAVAAWRLGGVTELVLRRKELTDLTPLAVPLLRTNLRALYLGDNKIETAAPLQKLTRLKLVELARNPVNDSATLGTIKDLFDLDLEDCGLTAFPVEGNAFWKLRKLSLAGNQVADAAFLAKLESIDELDLSGNPVGPAALAALAKPGRFMTALRLMATGLTDLSALKLETPLVIFEELDLSDNTIADLSPLAFVGNPTTLELSGMKLARLDTLPLLASVESLDLSNNELSDVSRLKDWAQLKQLGLMKNKVADASPLAALVKLETLYLGGNPGRVCPLANAALCNFDLGEPPPP